jgi:hypothetical protein
MATKPYLIFNDISHVFPERTTHTWNVLSTTNDTHLGQIRWYSHWRKYCFFPTIETIWDVACLNTIVDFINIETNKKKASHGYPI